MDETLRPFDRDDLEQVVKSSKEILEKSFEQLKSSASVKTDAERRFFFPDGIELIDVTVKANLKEGIHIGVKVAGPKGAGELFTLSEEDGSPA
jgi:hypothetical protein